MVRHDSSIKDQTANPDVFSSCGSAYERELRLWKTPTFRCVAKKTQLQQGSPLASLRFHGEADFAGTIRYRFSIPKNRNIQIYHFFHSRQFLQYFPLLH
jgi:hypothetical protein